MFFLFSKVTTNDRGKATLAFVLIEKWMRWFHPRQTIISLLMILSVYRIATASARGIFPIFFLLTATTVATKNLLDPLIEFKFYPSTCHDNYNGALHSITWSQIHDICVEVITAIEYKKSRMPKSQSSSISHIMGNFAVITMTHCA